jgi:hypothetical protein
VSKHNPKQHESCRDADRAADEQIAGLRAEVAQLEAELAAWRQHMCAPLPMQPHQWWTPPTTYPIITCSSGVAPADVVAIN